MPLFAEAEPARDVESELDAVFLCGYPKSGTSLLLALLDNHPELVVFPEETKFFIRVLPFPQHHNIGDLFTISKIDRLAGKVIKDGGGVRKYSTLPFAKLVLSAHQRWEVSQKSGRDLLQSLMAAYANVIGAQAAKAFVEKTPLNEQALPQAFNLWPNLRAIYICRDPRDNFTSYRLKRERRQEPPLGVEEFCDAWRKSLAAWRWFMVEHPKQALTLSYERLVERPDEEMRRVADFLDIKWTKALLNPSRAGDAWGGNSQYRESLHGIERASVGVFRQHLGDNEAAEIVNRCGPDWQALCSEAATPSSSAWIDWDPPSRRKPDFFIVGLPQSGSNALRRMLDAHPSIRCFSARSEDANNKATLSLLEVLTLLETDQRRFRKLLGKTQDGLFADLIPHEDLADAEAKRGLTEAICNRLNQFCHAQRVAYEKAIVGQRAPAYIQELGLLQSMYPKSVKLCMLRDPRDRCVSLYLREKGKGRLTERATVPAGLVERCVEQTRLDYKQLLAMTGPSFVLTNEDLKRDPAPLLAGALQALGLAQDEAAIGQMVAASEHRSSHEAGDDDGGGGNWTDYLNPSLAERMVTKLRPLTRKIESKFQLDLGPYGR